MKIKLGITGRLAVSFILIAAISQLINYHSSKILRKTAINSGEKEKIDSVSRLVILGIKSEGDRVRLVSRLLMMNDRFQSAMKYQIPERIEAISVILTKVYTESEVDFLEMTDDTGAVIYSATNDDNIGDLSNIWGVEEALSGKDGLVSLRKKSGAMIVSITPIWVNNRVAGTLLVGTEIGERFMGTMRAEVGAELMLLNRAGDMVASSAPERMTPENAAVVEAFMQKIPIYRNNSQLHKSLVYIPVLIVDEAWVVMAEVDSESAYFTLEYGDKQSLLFMTATVLGFIFATFIILRYSLKPLRQLRYQAESALIRLSGRKNKTDEDDEIVSMVNVFNTLTMLLESRNKELHDEKKKLETEVARSQLAAAEINKLAFYDTLTNLPNRRLLFVLLEREMASSERHNQIGALLFIDLDNFKTLNDTLGHDKGDILLKQAARRLLKCVRAEDVVSRLGGDEFIVLLKNLSDNANEAEAKARKVCEKILSTLNYLFKTSNGEHHCSASIGAAIFTKDNGTIDDLLKQADLAMYQAKAAGHNTIRFFHPDMQVKIKARAKLESDLREGILNDQFFLCYQGQITEDRRLIGAEALVRWNHPQRGIVAPSEFIPLAEETGLILPLGQWILETVCKQLEQWSKRAEMSDLAIAVNISARQFQQHNFVNQVLDVVLRSRANPKRLKLELTESLVLHNVDDIIIKMNALKRHGIEFSLDDFGTGYSSLSYLKLLPLDQVKIDRSFIRDILTDPIDAAIARIVINLADTLGLSTIAEGVESEEQRRWLTHIGCKIYQGYLFSPPLPLEDFEKFASTIRRRHPREILAEAML